MNSSMQEVLDYVRENDVKFIRLSFCDIFGRMKNISIMPDELPRAFESGISFDAAGCGLQGVEHSDLFLFPDPNTLTVMPWRPSHGRVIRLICRIRRPDGEIYPGDCRALLRAAVLDAASAGYSVRIGTECEFYLFKTDQEGNPTMIPLDHGSYCDVSPLDKGEDVRREICLSLEEMGIHPESSHHEQGHGQNEIDFRHSDPLKAADNLVLFKGAVKSIAAVNGLFASFLPKPFADQSGSGMHVNLSLQQNGKSLAFGADGSMPEPIRHFMAGVLRRIPDITLFLNPLANSYRRFGSFEAPKYISWSEENRSQLIRIPAATTPEARRMELRSPDPACNPYLAFALLIWAGLEGIRERAVLPEPETENVYELEDASALRSLPASLEEAAELAASSDFVKQHLPPVLLERFLRQKRMEAGLCAAAEDGLQTELELYFEKS